MKIDAQSSLRMSLLRFPLIVGVVFIHAYAAEVVISDGSLGNMQVSGLSTFVRDTVSQGVARVAVPLFFMMSGYFFFLSFDCSFRSYKNKLQSRAKTLFIPFVFWNFVTLLLVTVSQAMPLTKGYFSGNNNPVHEFEIYDYFNAIFGIDTSPVAYQFWFIRDLMIMVLLTPAIQLILNKLPVIFLSLVYFLWFLELWPLHIPSSVAFAFFYTGSFLSYYRYNPFGVDAYGGAVLLLYVVVLLIDVISKGCDINDYVHKFGVLLGVASALYVTKFALRNDKVKSFLLWSGSCGFFVFAIHEPLLTIARKIVYKILSPNTDMMVLMLYLSVPISVIFASILIYRVAKYLTPKLLDIVTGGR